MGLGLKIYNRLGAGSVDTLADCGDFGKPESWYKMFSDFRKQASSFFKTCR
jgi:hypothetical protein